MPSERNYCPCLEQFFIKFLSKAHFPGLMVQTSGNKYFSGNADTALTAEKWLVPQHCPAWIQPLCISLDIPASIPYMDWESSPHHVGNISTPESTWCIAKSWADQPSLCWRREISQSKAVWQPLLWDCFSVSHLCVGYCTEFLCKGQEALFYYKPFETRTWNILDLVMDRHFLHGNLKRCQSNRVKDSMNREIWLCNILQFWLDTSLILFSFINEDWTFFTLITLKIIPDLQKHPVCQKQTFSWRKSHWFQLLAKGDFAGFGQQWLVCTSPGISPHSQHADPNTKYVRLVGYAILPQQKKKGSFQKSFQNSPWGGKAEWPRSQFGYFCTCVRISEMAHPAVKA